MVVQCTWKSSEGRDINDAFSWALANESPENDVEEEVQAENCLLLVAPTDMSSEFLGAPACQLLISCHPMQKIQYISVLSDSRVMEVYGHHGEYLKTIKNELLEEVEDMAVFKGDIHLDKALNVCSIKFACLRSKTEMWLYGVKVSIINAPEQENTLISYAEVERRLNEMGLPLSDKAKLFKELVEANSGLPGLQNPDINAFINLFKTLATSKESLKVETVNNNDNNQNDANANDNNQNDANVNGILNTNDANVNGILNTNDANVNGISNTNDANVNGTSNTNDANVIDISNTNDANVNDFSNMNGAIKAESNELLNGINTNDDNNNNNSKSIELTDSSTQTLDPPPPSIEDVIKLHVDDKIAELEQHLLEKMEKSFKEIEAKLFCKLDEIESFVKPHGV